ncbi:prolyl oligopeptidase family serine peptidase [Paenibacillus sp. NPDC056579]|uniref:carboxylesterase family protein n=1 Tax=Paenibacillus sp. NPDC056579 TaxID=3345871 RepID=UPI00369ADE9C
MEKWDQTDQAVQLKPLGINYRVYVPNGYEHDADQAWPLVVFLQGARQRGNNSGLLEEHGPLKEAAGGKEFPFLLLAPQCPEDTVWIMQKDIVIGSIRSVQREYRVDPLRIYLTGISMGGFGTWEIAMEHPDLFAAIVPICGGGMSWRLSNLQHMPIWTFHGAKDEIVPIGYTVEMMRALKALGNQALFTVLPGAGHDCWTESYRRDDLYEWLLKQKRQQ